MKRQGQKNTVEITVGELSKLPCTVKVTVSVGWLRDYNKFAGQMGMPSLATGEEDAPETTEATAKGGLCNAEVG